MRFSFTIATLGLWSFPFCWIKRARTSVCMFMATLSHFVCSHWWRTMLGAWLRWEIHGVECPFGTSLHGFDETKMLKKLSQTSAINLFPVTNMQFDTFTQLASRCSQLYDKVYQKLTCCQYLKLTAGLRGASLNCQSYSIISELSLGLERSHQTQSTGYVPGRHSRSV